MAPKKKQQQQKSNKKPQSSSSSKGPKLQISVENEERLRRLLLNNTTNTSTVRPVPEDSLSKAQKAKKLKSIYEHLSCEGFTDDQIEQALSALKVFIFFFF